jgi:adenosylhomocysteine nucleosidase
MIGIICAMDEEAAPFKASFVETDREEVFGHVFRRGALNNRDVVLVVSGIGTTNAAIATTILIERYGVERIVMSGVAGSIGALGIGEVLIARSCVYHDVDATAFGYAPGQVPHEPERFDASDAQTIAERLNVTTSVIASGNAFVSDPNRVERIREAFGADAIDMESAAVAHVCTHARIPWTIIRAMSDAADADAKDSFEERLVMAAQSAAHLTIRIVGSRARSAANTSTNTDTLAALKSTIGITYRNWFEQLLAEDDLENQRRIARMIADYSSDVTARIETNWPDEPIHTINHDCLTLEHWKDETGYCELTESDIKRFLEMLERTT